MSRKLTGEESRKNKITLVGVITIYIL